jgi:glutamyl-tRNA synthetase
MVEDSKELPEKVRSSMEAAALLNATRHGGKAETGAVMSRILSEFPELRSIPGPVAKAVQGVVKRVNGLSTAQQEALQAEKYPVAQGPAPRGGRVGLPPLPNAIKGKSSFRLPPEPSGFMHIGHAMAFTINFLYKQQYDGELWLRFEDTNPRKVDRRYYQSFRESISWLGIEWDHEKNVSDDMEVMYRHGQKLIETGTAYACSCDEQKVKRLRFDGRPCEHRGNSAEDNLKVWKELVYKMHKEGEYVIRFKGDMQNLNYSLRDPNIFRVIEHPHPLTGTRYSLWPTYDFANAVEDEICGVTHILRSSEFRNELQQLIRDALGFRRPEVIQFSRFNFKGTPVGKRLLRPLVEGNLVSGWDDPRMPTVDGLKRRGIIPQAIREFTLQVGYTKTEHEYDWSVILSINRKLLDPASRRMFFVPDPVRLDVEGAPKRKVTIPFHPQHQLGVRTIETRGRFYVPETDLKAMKPGFEFRLMDLYNVELTSGGPKFAAKYAGEELDPDAKKFQWVAEANVEARVLVPGPLFSEAGEFNPKSLNEVHGVAEESLGAANPGEIMQFPRFGFCRLDSPGTLILSS